ncbi:MAG: YraN family protein [Candidatus Omnitrophica bacterium]|nr:YraN family protein [Candidatus Omnitrophota bacterium]
MDNVGLGRKAQALAEGILRRNGYRLLERNVRARFGEIDLVARDGNTLCLVEVKSRTGVEFGFPEEAVDSRKRRQLTRLALWYGKRRGLLEGPIRFDVVAVIYDGEGRLLRSRLLKGAFEAEGHLL